MTQTMQPSMPRTNCVQPYRLCHVERLILDLYCAETLAVGPGSLTLRKVSAPFDPTWCDARSRRGYYVVFTQNSQVKYRRYGLSELPKARACFDALVELMPAH